MDGQGGDYSTFDFSSAAFSNGTTIPNGDYRRECFCCPHVSCQPKNTDGLLVLMRALHITGDKTKEADYESCKSTDLSARFP